MSPPFFSETLFPYQRSYDVKHNPKTITAVRASDRQIWTFQAQAATGCCLCTPEASAQHNTSRRHHVLWPCPVRLAFRAANEWRPSSFLSLRGRFSGFSLHQICPVKQPFVYGRGQSAFDVHDMQHAADDYRRPDIPGDLESMHAMPSRPDLFGRE